MPWTGFVKSNKYMKPTIGLIVKYTTSENDKSQMEAASPIAGGCNIMDELPAIVTAVWSETCVNLRVVCDGHLDLWKTSAPFGTDVNQWSYIE